MTLKASDMRHPPGANISTALLALDASMPGLIGARKTPGTLLTGTIPKTPQRVFAE